MTYREWPSLVFMNRAMFTPYEHKGINYITKAARNPNRKEQEQEQENKVEQRYPICYPKGGEVE